MEYPALTEVPSMSNASMLKVLKDLRTKPARRSELVVKIGERIISGSSMGIDKWLILEQVAVAGMDIAYWDIAERCIAMLASQFGENARKVLRLKGMFCEAKGDFTAAEVCYNDILEKNPTDKQVKWRKVAILKAQGKFDDAVKELEAQMKITQIAEEGYIELMNLHLSSKNPDYEKSLTHCEELILQNPTNYCWHMLYAEILCTAKPTLSNLVLARKYYCESILQNDGLNNLRAYWGLWSVCKSINAAGSLTPSEQSENTALLTWTTERLSSCYDKFGSPQKDYAALLLSEG